MMAELPVNQNTIFQITPDEEEEDQLVPNSQQQ